MFTIPVKPTHDELAVRWIANHKDIVYSMGSFRQYSQGIWNEISEAQVKKEIYDQVCCAKTELIKPTISIISSVLEMCRINVMVDDAVWDSDPNIIVCLNGTLDIRTRELRPHSMDDYATVSLPYRYCKKATAPAWYKLLSRLPADIVDLLQEYSGYCLTTETKYEIALWLFGPPGSGKTTFLIGLQTMAGPKCCQLGLREIERSRFTLTSLLGKTIAISSEQPVGSFASSDLLNKLISGEPIIIEKKYRDPYEFTPRVKMLWAMNELPRIPSRENGLSRRVQIIEIPPLPSADRDPEIKVQIQNEGPGILNWALDGLDRLRARGRFLIPESVSRATDEFRGSNNHTDQFLTDECICGNGYAIQASILNQRYSLWCERNGHKPFSSTLMAKTWLEIGFNRYEKNGCRFIVVYH